MASALFDKRCLSIQSHVVHGYVGNKSAVFPLQLLGFDVCAANSVQLSSHTGYSVIKGQILTGEQLSTLMDGLVDNGLMAFSHILSGYISAPSAAATLSRVVTHVRSIVPTSVFVCDPVLGDHGKLYVPPDLVPIYREQLVPLATILTPNQFEAEVLTEGSINDLHSAFKSCEQLHALGARMVVITSTSLASTPVADDMLLVASCPWEAVRDDWSTVFAGMERAEGTHARFTIAIPKLPSVFTGSGDLTAALLLAHFNATPHSLVTACERTIATVQAVCKRTMAHYAACIAALEAERASAAAHGQAAGGRSWLEGMASSSSGQMGGVIPAFNELRVVQSKDDIEHPVVPDTLRAVAR